MAKELPEEKTTKELLTKLKENEIYSCLVKKGIIPLKVNYYLEISELYDVRMVVNEPLNDCVMQSLTDVSVSFNCSETSVRRAIKFINE